MKVKGLTLVIVTILIIGAFSRVLAGSTLDYGTVPGTPPVGEVNWLAWLNKNITPGGYPSEVLTEDSTNSGLGLNQGYQILNGLPRWILQVVKFSNEEVNNTVTILLGGLGASSGNGWTDSFNWVSSEFFSDQGEAMVVPDFDACPVMQPGSQESDRKIVNWTGVASEYLIYRSQNESGAGNGASNGFYTYIDSVPSGTFTYSDYDCGTGVNCWHIVVPANGSGVINGCHSEESNPTAITLSAFSASSHIASPWVLVLGVGLLVAILAAAVILRRRSKIAA
jgi:hypothetical protein